MLRKISIPINEDVDRILKAWPCGQTILAAGPFSFCHNGLILHNPAEYPVDVDAKAKLKEYFDSLHKADEDELLKGFAIFTHLI